METGDTDAERQKLERLEEVQWVTEAQAGDSEAFGRLMNRYEKRLLYYLRRIVPEGDWALDLHQDVWIEVFRGLPSLEIPEAFRAWIYRIAHHKAARFIRNEKRREKKGSVAAEAIPQQEYSDRDVIFNVEALHQGMQLLPTEHRELLVLHYLRDLSTQELALVLDCPSGTIKSRLHHARQALRRIIERKKL